MTLPSLSPGSLVSFLVAVSFAAGLNLYATTATLGLLARLHWVQLPAGLDPLANTWVIAASLILFACELFADKIPFLDLVWNAAHTFIRIPVAALLAWRASAPLSPGAQALVVLLAGAIAAAAHGSKITARALVTPSPEPVSNIALSASEDVGAIGLTWLATQHPVAAAIAVGVALAAVLWFARLLVKTAKLQFARLRQRLA